MLSNNYYENIMEHLPNGYAYYKIVLDNEGKPVDYIFLDVNIAFEKLTGLSKKDIIGKKVTEVICGFQYSDFGWIQVYGEIAINSGSIEFKQYSSNFNKWYKVTAYSNRQGYFVTILNDITEEIEVEVKFREKEKELKEAHRIAKLGRWDFYHKESKMEWTETMEDIFEQNPEKIYASYDKFFNFIHPKDREKVDKVWKDSLISKEPYIIEYRLIMKDRSIKWVKGQTKTKFDEAGKAIHSIGIMQDITDIKEAEEELIRKHKQIEYLSFHDHLTKLYNRRFFEEELERLDTKRNLPLSIIMGDVDGLKILNDTFGHVTGDKLLIKVAKTLKNNCRADDIIARRGGDEFEILLPKTTSLEAKKIIKRIKRASAREKIKDMKISISLGYGTKMKETEDIEDIRKLAENGMYQDKRFIQMGYQY